MKKTGFTIFEIVVGSFIIILLMLISIPLFNGFKKTTKLRSEARTMATNIRLAQQLAVTEQVKYLVVLDKNNEYYEIVNNNSGEIVKKIYLDSEIDLNSFEGFSDSQIEFNSAGGVNDSGKIYLTNSRHQTSTLEIKPSGYVQVSD